MNQYWVWILLLLGTTCSRSFEGQTNDCHLYGNVCTEFFAFTCEVELGSGKSVSYVMGYNATGSFEYFVASFMDLSSCLGDVMMYDCGDYSSYITCDPAGAGSHPESSSIHREPLKANWYAVIGMRINNVSEVSKTASSQFVMNVWY